MPRHVAPYRIFSYLSVLSNLFSDLNLSSALTVTYQRLGVLGPLACSSHQGSTFPGLLRHSAVISVRQSSESETRHGGGTYHLKEAKLDIYVTTALLCKCRTDPVVMMGFALSMVQICRLDAFFRRQTTNERTSVAIS
jgi:hypothetical protein